MIFCIGHSKTGTRSLAEALHTLGYNVCHGQYDINELLIRLNLDCEALSFDGYADIPIIWQRWRYLSDKYPNSKFIYTYRDNESWIESRKKHIEEHPRTRCWYWFDQPPEIWVKEKNAQEKQIQSLGECLLWMDIFNGDGYDKLCSFLNKPIPDKPFPHIS